MKKIQKIMELLESDYGIKGTAKQVLAKKEIAEKLILTTEMDPFNSQEDAKKVLKVLKKCQKIATKNDLMDQIGDILKFLEMVILGKLENDLKENPEPVLNKEEALEINKLANELSNTLNETFGVIIKKDTTEDKDYECDIVELPSNFINGKVDEPSGIRLSKLMEIAFVKKDNGTVSLTATNLPKEISKKEFKNLLKADGLWLNKETILKEGDHRLKARILYSKKSITLLLVDKNVKIETGNKEIIAQKIVLIQKKTKNGKVKLKIPEFLNIANMKVKDIIKSKSLRKFLKEVEFDHSFGLVANQYCIDDQNNFYRICIPYGKRTK